MKICIVCRTTETQKWYKDVCRKCYSKSMYHKRKTKDPFFAKHKSEKVKLYRKTDKGSFNLTKGNALKRGIKWDLSFEDFKQFRSIKECFYCEGKLPQVCGGLDRTNNDIGYTKSNLVRCCEKCNDFKKNLLSFEEMKQVISLLKKMRNGKLW